MGLSKFHAEMHRDGRIGGKNAQRWLESLRAVRRNKEASRRLEGNCRERSVYCHTRFPRVVRPKVPPSLKARGTELRPRSLAVIEDFCIDCAVHVRDVLRSIHCVLGNASLSRVSRLFSAMARNPAGKRYSSGRSRYRDGKQGFLEISF